MRANLLARYRMSEQQCLWRCVRANKVSLALYRHNPSNHRDGPV
jgi:hypothetical protein